ncbi:hypothetical protein [Actinoplanes sp. NPDC051851]|uniref:hypothetical protein n=1 Tax=Actinoplanes sp. NPDC051851 TaxID=3154753 RepID=UPI003423AEC2
MGINQRLARTEDMTDRIPTWDEFTGPRTGVVELPNRIFWSGVPAFDVENAPRRLTLYTTLIGDGQRADLARWINRDLLVRDWPKIRMLTAQVLVRAWEGLLPELAAA